MVTVKIENDDLLAMLIERLKFWTNDNDVIELYTQMYERYIEDGCLDGMKLDINNIVDNDYINWCHIIDETDDDYQAILDHYNAGDYDISCDNLGYSFIEAVTDNKEYILVRQ